MDFQFTEEQEMIRSMVREFVEKEVKPFAAQIDREGQIPPRLLEQARELGLFGLPFPEEYGGAGAGETGYCIMQEELCHGCNSLAGLIGAHTSICSTSIYLSGSEEQKKKYLPSLTQGEKIGAYALTEAGAGSDAAAIKTVAERQGNEWLLNGTKHWITNGDIAGIFVVFAITGKPDRPGMNVSAFIVERGTPGITVGKPDEKLGLHGMHSPEVHFENVRIPHENLLGGEGKGFLTAMRALDLGRLGLGACCLGSAKEMLNISIAYAQQRITFGKPIAEHQAIQFMLSEMATTIYAMEGMVYRTAWMCDTGKKFSRESAIVKYFCSESLSKIIDMALQIHGGMGYMRELPIERFYRDSRVYRIFEGTSEIQRIVIARDLVKKGMY
ncbi:MAG: acyl-CoA dehydrogenase [Planctomycetes bacterium RBG_16_59_8]|nr:MAG: acyl-CoA dehydrogenase [Planctomycetes bacterium RBG_16_59_8]